MNKRKSQIIQLLFLIMIFIPCIFIFFTIVNNYNNFKSTLYGKNITEYPQLIEDYIDDILSNKITLELYGSINKLLGKNEIKNFEVLKSEDGNLYLSNPLDFDVNEVFDNILDLYHRLDNDCNFIFVQAPFKNATNIDSLLNYPNNNLDFKFDELIEKLTNAQINTLDLRANAKTISYYNTDHHWTNTASFYAAGDILRKIGVVENYNKKLDISNYDIKINKQSFLGSLGIKSGEKFVGKKDDFEILVPLFETNFVYEHYIDGNLSFMSEGDFESAFINLEMMYDTNYLNKYNANLHGGYVENVIINKDIKDGSKLLLISHSYGRNMVQYLSQFFNYTVYLDPQKGRYNEAIDIYIGNYRPDYIILMYNDILNLGK